MIRPLAKLAAPGAPEARIRPLKKLAAPGVLGAPRAWICLLLAGLLLFGSLPVQAAAKPAYSHYLKALLLQRQGLYDEALREYQAVVTIDPESPYVLLQAGELALDIGQTQLSREFAEQLTEIEPTSAKAHHLLGNIHWSEGDIDEARRSFERALALDPKNLDTLYSMGNLLSATAPMEAKTYYLRYLEEDPSSASEVTYQIALLENRAGHAEAALDRLRKAIELDPKFLQARYSLAQMYENRRDTGAAYAEYEALLPLDPQNTGLLVRLGEITAQRGEKKRSEELFSRAAAVEPSNPAARFWLAFLAEQEGSFDRAANHLSRSSALAEDPALNLRLSYYLTQAGRLQDAVAVLEQARSRWPDNSEVAYFLSLGYDDLGRRDEAAKAMETAVRLKPDSREARFQLAALYEKLDRVEDSEREFRVLLAENPDDAVVLNYLGYSLADRGLKLKEAERLIRQALKLDPGNSAYLDSLGWVLHKRGLHAEGLQDVRRALAAIPTDAVVWEHIGDIEEALGRNGPAWSAWMTSRHYGGEAAELETRLKRAEGRLNRKDLGKRYLDFLGSAYGAGEPLDALVRIEGKVRGRSTSLTGLMQFADGRLKIDVLGPFFLPLWRLTHDGKTADLGGLELEGLSKEQIQKSAGKVLELVRLFLDGEPFHDKSPRFKHGWTRNYIDGERFAVFLKKGAPHRLASIRPKSDRRYLLELLESRQGPGRLLPVKIRVKGPGFSVELKLEKMNLPARSTPWFGFSPPPAAAP